MTLIVENGTGLAFANTYNGLGFIRFYLVRRNRVAAFDAASLIQQKSAAIAATDYLDRRFGRIFKGVKFNRDIDIPATTILSILSLPTDADTITLGAETYKFVTTLAAAFDVLIGATPTATAANLVAAVMAGPGAGSTYGVGTTANTTATAAQLDSGPDVMATAIIAGELETDIVSTSSNETSCIWDNEILVNGISSADQALEFPRTAAFFTTGNPIIGVPNVLKEAHAEYTERALAAALMPDPITDKTGRIATTITKKIGPIETTNKYSDSTSFDNLIKSYPNADRLLRDLLGTTGGVIR